MSEDATKNQGIVPGFKLRHTLRNLISESRRLAWSPKGRRLAAAGYDGSINIWNAVTGEQLKRLTGHTNVVYSVSWSPGGRLLVSGGRDQTVRIWDTATGELLKTLKGHVGPVLSVAWSPQGQRVASGSDDMTVRLWDVVTDQSPQILEGHYGAVHCVAWSARGQLLASGSNDGLVRIWNGQTGKLDQTLRGHTGEIYSLAWSPCNPNLASVGFDRTIHLWDTTAGQHISTFEGHVGHVTDVTFSSDGAVLATASWDDTVRLWRCDNQETVAILNEMSVPRFHLGLAFNPQDTTLATLGEKAKAIHIWDINFDDLLRGGPPIPAIHYANAKVVLVGDTGVGKTGLGLVLTGQKFQPTESTHGRHVWTFASQTAKLKDGGQETRETILWDLAGQPGYRLIHQLHLNEIAVALIVFDARSETNPFAGVRHWDRALRLAHRLEGEAALPLKKFLVAGRADRGGVGVSPARIEALLNELGFDGYFETSAREGWRITELAEAIRGAIAWGELPKVSSTELFQQIKEFLIAEKQSGRLLSTDEDLYRAFLRTEQAPPDSDELQAQFETCIGRVQSRGLIRELSFGGLILLQPELLDAYASAMVNAAKDEPDGLGSLAEEDARLGRFRMPQEERIRDVDQERLLLIATVEDLLRHEIALRESTESETLLIFPSQFTREKPDAPAPKGQSVIYRFEGPILNIYTTLAVRLSRSGVFTKEEMWKNAATFTTRAGGSYGLYLREMEEGLAELILFFDPATSETMRFQFEEYVHAHLQRRALANTIERRRIFVCPECGEPITDSQAQKRQSRGFDWIRCNVCDTKVSLKEGIITAPATTSEIDRTADALRDQDTAASILQGKIATGDYDVFLCHSNEDKPMVKRIGTWLKWQGILPWLDEWELRPGLPWQRALEDQIERIKSAAVFVGKNGIGPWQRQELEAFLREFVNRGCPVIPVLLPDAPHEPDLPLFLRGMTWIDLRQKDPDTLKRFLWGITGERAGY